MTSASTEKLEVLVIGAGPTGLVMASEMARRGVACRIVDKASEPSRWSRAIGIQARTLELFENMGTVEPFTRLGHKAHGVHLAAEGREIIHITFDALDTAYPYLLFLPQTETERILTEHLENLGGKVERATELIALTSHNEEITATLRHADGQEEAVPTSWLIGCDGAHSTVRHQLGLPFEGRTQDARFLLADVGLRWSQSDDEFYIYIHRDGLLGIFPLGQGRYRIVADNPPQDASTNHPAPTLEECQAIVSTRAQGDITLTDPTWTAYFRISYRMVTQFRQGRVFLAGDAASIHSPAGAQGMNTGIQDVFNLAWKLALVTKGAADPTLLDSYQAERYPVEHSVLRQSEIMIELASLRHPVAQSLRDRLLPLLTGLDLVQDRMRRTISELAIHYRQSPIVEDHSLGGSVVAGDRAPDAPLVRADTGAATRLFPVLQDTRHTLLLLSGNPPQPDTIEKLQQIGATVQGHYGPTIATCLILAGETPPSLPPWNGLLLLDPTSALHQRYGGGHPGLYLVRPDTYIGYRSSLTDADRLLAYLTRLFR